MPGEPLALHITWTTYGTWLPGDERGWVDANRPGIQPPDVMRREDAERRLADEPVWLTPEQRAIVEATLSDHAAVRGWTIHAKSVRTNHVHVVVTSDRDPKVTRDELKSWCSRRLNEAAGIKRVWWTRGGSIRPIGDERYLVNAIHYVNEGQ